MRATYIYGAGDVRVIDAPEAQIEKPGDALVRVVPVGFGSLFGPNITLTGGPAPARAYIEPLLPGVLHGSVQPGKVFDRTVALDQTPDAYAAMDNIPAFTLDNGVQIPARASAAGPSGNPEIGDAAGEPNFEVFDFAVTAEQLAAIDTLDTGVRGGPEPDDITREKYGIEIPEI
jgi:hypothetical protein